MQELEIDRIDREILRLLQQDSELSAAAIGEQIGLSQSPCWRRIQRLKDEGLIQGQVMRFDRKKLGFDVMVFAQVKLTAHGRSKVPEFAETIRQFPEVQECHLVLGNIDFLLRIVVRDIEAYEGFFFKKLSHLPEIQEVHSNIVLSEIKYTTELPI
ncbi:MAG: Lrp/AsnC family transcriptional regulator [Gammaproteobacteria bacterium]|nr:Lrp/AsnC family transcriptional regulator [Gammaproteobacteria bacterium]NNK31917.1 Lrp/AsnC family transcriptional regulator [Xanthomonadales bacterium]